MTLERSAVNPVTWSQEMGFNQGEVISGETRTLYISGQTAMSKDGRPEHDGDVEAQLALAGQRWHRERLHQFVGSPFPSADELQAMDWGTPLLLALLPWVVALLGLRVRRWRRRRAA